MLKVPGKDQREQEAQEPLGSLYDFHKPWKDKWACLQEASASPLNLAVSPTARSLSDGMQQMVLPPFPSCPKLSAYVKNQKSKQKPKIFYN